MRRWRTPLLVLCVLLSGKRVGATCPLSSMSIETTEEGLTISGCYRESVFAGLYETTVWTIEGTDVTDTGTSAIVADLQNGPSADAVWTIGTVVSLPANTWSDGTNAGLEVINLVCVGTSIFWETKDPTEEVQWECDSNGDGVLTAAEAGDFDVVECGCGDEIIENSATPSPAAVPVGSSTLSPSSSIGGAPSPAPVANAAQPSPAPGVVDEQNPGTAATPAPANGERLAPEALACNLTLSSETLQDVAGCYVGQASSNSRGYWVKFDRSSWIEWIEISDDRYWAIVRAEDGLVGGGETRCISEVNAMDPVDIPGGRWICDADGDRDFDEEQRGDFTGLQCSQECTNATSLALEQGTDSSSDNDSDRSTAIIVGSVLGVILLGGLAVVAFALMKRKHRTKAEGVPPPAAPPATAATAATAANAATAATAATAALPAPPAPAAPAAPAAPPAPPAPSDPSAPSAVDEKGAAPADPNAKPPSTPVFEPWGSRPPPRHYG